MGFNSGGLIIERMFASETLGHILISLLFFGWLDGKAFTSVCLEYAAEDLGSIGNR